MENPDDFAKQVMIAEDDDEDFLIFSVAMKETSFRVLLTHVTNGELLLKLLEEKVPDVLFLDLLLPRIDGKQCLKAIRGSTRYDTLPVIIYSSLSDLMNQEYCFREGANLYFIKPSRFEELPIALERILTINWSKTLYFPTRDNFVIKGFE